MTEPTTDNIFFKLTLVWTAVFAGWTITHWAALAALVYTVLQIVVLVRDKFIRHGRP